MAKATEKSASKTAVTRAKVNLPANINEQMAADAAKLAERLAAPTGNAIQITQGKEFRTPDGATGSTLRAIIVDFVSYNRYYEGGYDKDNITPPNCFAIGAVKNDDLEPSPNSPDKQSADCASCTLNKFGSAGRGKACVNTKLLALLAPDATDDSPLMTLRISATALKAFDAYVSNLIRITGRAPYAVTTEFSFDPNVDYASVRLGNPEPCTKEQLEAAYMRRDDALKMLLTEPDFSAAEAPAAKKPALKKPAAARARA